MYEHIFWRLPADWVSHRPYRVASGFDAFNNSHPVVLNKLAKYVDVILHKADSTASTVLKLGFQSQKAIPYNTVYKSASWLLYLYPPKSAKQRPRLSVRALRALVTAVLVQYSVTSEMVWPIFSYQHSTIRRELRWIDWEFLSKWLKTKKSGTKAKSLRIPLPFCPFLQLSLPDTVILEILERLSISQTFSLPLHSTTEFFVFQQSFYWTRSTFRLENSSPLRVEAEEGPCFRVKTSCSIKRLLEDEELCC